MRENAILGYTGFVGSNLALQINDFDGYNSKNLKEIIGKYYKNIYCACIPGVKYIANKEPSKDLQNIFNIIDILKTVKCDNFFLVSSQDCNSTLNSNEIYSIDPPTEYGKNRLLFENFIKSNFNAYILRIGCLFGKNLRKNIIFDLLTNNPYLNTIHEDSTMQLYCLDDLKNDFQTMFKNNLHLSNKFSEPIKISEIINVYNNVNKNYIKILKPSNKGYNNKISIGNYVDKAYILDKLKRFFING